jgi:hypothetical protein
MIQEHFPAAAFTTVALPLAAGDAGLFVLCLTAMILMIPFIYGRDVDAIVKATAARNGIRR